MASEGMMLHTPSTDSVLVMDHSTKHIARRSCNVSYSSISSIFGMSRLLFMTSVHGGSVRKEDLKFRECLENHPSAGGCHHAGSTFCDGRTGKLISRSWPSPCECAWQEFHSTLR